MNDYRLIRSILSDKGCFGILAVDKIPLCVTCEDPWNENKPKISCIPAGIYRCMKHNGPKYKDVWEITNVPKRTSILIHAGNSIADTQGCVLVGKGFALFNGMPAITESRQTIEYLRRVLPDIFTITIMEKSLL